VALLSLRDVDKAHAGRPLLRGIGFALREGERVGLVGPNGAGKSTLLRILAGVEAPDEGVREAARGLEIGYLEQEPKIDGSRSIREEVRRGAASREATLRALERLHEEMAAGGAPAPLLARQVELEERLAALGGHDVEHRLERLVHAMGLPDPEAPCGSLSGGERRRVAIARLLFADADVLLLDEPTNHLDAFITDVLEDLLLERATPLVMVTHDRYFLDRIVDRIVELDRGSLHSHEGGYESFLEARAARLEVEERTERARLVLLRRETAWMRKRAKAQRTKGKARLRRFAEAREIRAEAPPGAPEFTIPPGPPLGRKVIRFCGVSKAFGSRTLLRNVDLEVNAGERIGVVGANGAGKSTFLRLCRGAVPPDEGRVETGPTVRFAAVDQSRDDLDPARSVLREVGGGEAEVMVGGRPVRVESYLEKFLFPRSAQQTLVGMLSGGERNRVLLAKMLLRGGNVLLLDEPTNDLDLMTLRVLEEALIAFEGAALVVSHDRWFLDRVATRILYLDGKGGVRHHPGDMTSLLESLRAAPPPAPPAAKEERAPAPRRAARAKGLAWAEQRERESLPDRIAAAEAELAALDARLADASFYAGPPAAVREATSRRSALSAEIEALYARWGDLEARA